MLSVSLFLGTVFPATVYAKPVGMVVIKQESDMAAFKKEQQRKLKENEERIEELKRMRAGTKAKIDNAYDSRIAKLEQANAELNRRITIYNDTDKSKWEEFKREFNHDMDELGQAIKDLFRDNSK